MPNDYYCHSCASSLSLIPGYSNLNLVGMNSYQVEKFLKHTILSTSEDKSVFSDPATSTYLSYMIDARLAGSVEIQRDGKRNLILAAGQPVGFYMSAGRIIRPEHMVKVVYSTDLNKIHAYPESSTAFETSKCITCCADIIR